MKRPADPLWRRSLPVIGAATAVVLGVLLCLYLFDVILLVFAGVLLAVLMRAPADAIAARGWLGARWALALVLVASFALLGAGGWFFGREIAGQLGELFQSLPQIAVKVREKFAQFSWALEPLGIENAFGGRGVSLVSATFGAAADLVIVFFLGLFLALQPDLYLSGALRLLPREARARTREVLCAVGHTLRWWLVGQGIMMAAIAVLSGVGLWLLDVPMAFALALLAGVLEFIPYVGPILGAVPALLVALGQDPLLAGYVLALFAGVQAVEGYVLQPIVQRKTVYLAPALVLVAQVVLFLLVGLLGGMLATPIAAALLVVARMLYLEDVLGERPASHHGSDPVSK